MGDGRGDHSLSPSGSACALEPIFGEATGLQVVAKDMSAAYVESGLEDMPDIALVLGYFHAMKVMNDKFSKVRNRRCG